jgi:hypothetical protein
MAKSLSLDQMSVGEKIRAMKSLWDDLCRRANDVASPSWHRDILAEREAALGNGEDHFEDWETAKGKIENELP